MDTSTMNYSTERTENIEGKLNSVLVLSVLGVLTYMGTKNYLLFHTIIELITIIIGFSITITAFNTYKVTLNQQLIFLGIGYGFISIIDLIHTLAYKGMNIFPGITINEPAQLWLGGRYMESITLLVVALSFHNIINHKKAIVIYSMMTVLLIVSVFYWNIFPNSNLPGIGLTLFKIISELIISSILFISMILLRKNRKDFSPKIFSFIMYSFVFTILSEICFIFYIDVYGFSNMLGHHLKLISFYFIYKAVVEVHLKEPYYLLIESRRKLIEENQKRSQMQSYLQQEEVILQKILNSLEEGIMVMNNVGNVIHYNDNFVDMWNIPYDVLQSRNNEQMKMYATHMLQDPKGFLDRIDEIYSSNHEESYELALKDGRYFRLFMTPFEVYHIKGWVHSFRDITYRKKREKMLRQSGKNYQALLDSIPDAVLLHQNMKCIYANVASARLLRVKEPSELVGRDLTSFIPPAQKGIMEKRRQEIQRKKGKYKSAEYEIMDINKKLHYIEEISSIHSQEEKRVVLTILRDITEKKIMEALRNEMDEKERRMEERRKINQFKIDFYTNLSHELKTPINIISAVAHMIKREVGENSQTTMRYTTLLTQNCNRMIRLINNLIDINKIDSGYFQMEMQNCNIVQVIEDIALSVVPYIEEKNIEFTFDTDIEEVVTAVDINSMERIILNLLSNAIKFTNPGGEIQVMIKDLGHELAVSIEDTGIGMEKHKLKDIFERFKQADHSLRHNPRGSGIGLSLVKHMVEMQGGRIEVHSEVGKGSQFKVIFPVEVLKDQEGSADLEVFSLDKMDYKETASIELSDVYF